MGVTQISIGRFHHFHLARQLERLKLLDEIWTGYPYSRLKDESGLPRKKIKTYPWIQAPYMAFQRLTLKQGFSLNQEWEWLAQQSIDKHVAAKIKRPTIVMALSSSGLKAGTKAQQLGGSYICDRGSSHVVFQNELLKEEYKKWGFRFKGIDERIIRKEEAEYNQCDIITVPSEFVKRSFLERGVPEYKLKKVVYGARFDRFTKTADPDKEKFCVLWVGKVCLRKGFMYLLTAFQNFKHSNKELLVIGDMEPEIKQLLRGQCLDNIKFEGQVSNALLPTLYSRAHVFVLPSIEEGLAMVQGEALSCGCPVIATPNSGAEDLFTDGKEGFIVPIRCPSSITEKFELISQNPVLQKKMSENCVSRIQSLGGWNNYGDTIAGLVKDLSSKERIQNS